MTTLHVDLYNWLHWVYFFLGVNLFYSVLYSCLLLFLRIAFWIENDIAYSFLKIAGKERTEEIFELLKGDILSIFGDTFIHMPYVLFLNTIAIVAVVLRSQKANRFIKKRK